MSDILKKVKGLFVEGGNNPSADIASESTGNIAAGDDAWKQVYVQGGGTTASASTRGTYTFGPEVAYVEVEFTGNTGQAVTVECTGDSYAY